MPTPTLNVLAELYGAREKLEHAQKIVAAKQETFYGRLPWWRNKLRSAQIQIAAQKIRVDAGIEYLESTENR